MHLCCSFFRLFFVCVADLPSNHVFFCIRIWRTYGERLDRGRRIRRREEGEGGKREHYIVVVFVVYV